MERCNLLRAAPPHLQPNTTQLLDAATQTFPHSAASADASTQLPLAEFSLGCICPEDPLDCLVPPLAHDITCPTCTRPIPPLVLDAAAQTPSHSVASADATTQLPLTEFFLGCICSNDPTDRSVPPPTHGDASSASLLQSTDTATICSPSSTSRTSERHACTTTPRARLHSAPPPPPGLEDMPTYAPHMGSLLKQRRCDPVCIHPPQFRPCSHMSVPPKWEHILYVHQLPTKGVQAPPLRDPPCIGADPRAGRGPFPKPRALVLSMVRFGQTKPDGLGHIDTVDSDLMHHQYFL